MVNRTFYSPRKTFLWYTGELHANETRNGIKVDYEVRSKREAGFCQGEMQVVEHGTEFGPVDMNRFDRTVASYLPNRVCDWVISAPYGHKINLEVRKMNFLPGDRLTIDDEYVIEVGPDCSDRFAGDDEFVPAPETPAEFEKRCHELRYGEEWKAPSSYLG